MNSNNSQEYILLRAKALNLLVPRHEVVTIAHLQSRAEANQFIINDKDVLESRIDNEQTSYMALNEDLSFIDRIENEQFIYTSFDKFTHIRFCWSEVRMLNKNSFHTDVIPECIKKQNMLVEEIVSFVDQTHGFITHSDLIFDYLMKS